MKKLFMVSDIKSLSQCNLSNGIRDVTKGPHRCSVPQQGEIFVTVLRIMGRRENSVGMMGLKKAIESFHMTSQLPYWYSKTMKWWPC